MIRFNRKRDMLLEYNETVPAQEWMSGARVEIFRELQGCAGCGEALGNAPVAELPLFKEEVERPNLQIMVAQAEEKRRSFTRSAYLNFKVNQSALLADYMNNPVELAKIYSSIDSIREDNNYRIARIEIVGYSSPEGSYAANEKLAHDRANGFRNYLDTEYGLARRFPVEVRYVGEDWDRLRQLVEASTLPGRAEVLAVIDNTDIFKGREKKLMDLQGGVPYNLMLAELFPLLRRVEIRVEYDLHRIIEERYRRKLTDAEFQEILARERASAEADERRLAELRQLETEKRQRAEQIRLEEERVVQARRKEEQLRREEEERLKEQRFREQWLAERAAGRQARREARKQRNRLLPLLSVKTNLYTWAGMTPDFDYTAFTPNLSAEFFFARRWSAVASAAYADWDYDSGKCHWGVSAYSLEPRFWVNGDGCYRWCYVGIYGQLGDFDNRSVDSGRIAGGTANCTGTYWEGGLSVGCYILLDAHWGIEAGLRGGYRASDANAYDVEMPYYYFNRNFRENHFGVTGVNISISYRFGSRK